MPGRYVNDLSGDVYDLEYHSATVDYGHCVDVSASFMTHPDAAAMSADCRVRLLLGRLPKSSIPGLIKTLENSIK